MPKYANIQLPLAFDNLFTYEIPQGMELNIGEVVRVPFGTRSIVGIIFEFCEELQGNYKSKQIIEKINAPALSNNMIKFVAWVANYTLSPAGNVLKMVYPVNRLFDKPKRKPKSIKVEPTQAAGKVSMDIDLTAKQHEAYQVLQRAICANEFSANVLDGVTGSGKTEVYFKAIEDILNLEQGQVVILLPEIILTNQVVARFKKRFGFSPVQWHSNLTPKQRKDNFNAIMHGDARLVIGARSALFLPYKDLKLLVVDEEHDASFKQEEGVIYHARDMAIIRANFEKIPILLCSATPSVETMLNVEQGKYNYLHLPSRHGKATLPDIEVVDMRTANKTSDDEWLSDKLKQALNDNFKAGKQSLLYLNRRGYAPLTLCRACGYRYQCKNCSAWLVMHKNNGRLNCHHCGYFEKFDHKCKNCGEEDSLVACGPGVERLAEKVARIVPDARITLLTSDNAATAKQAESIVNSIINKEVDIIIGTQLIAKGHHFPSLTLVGIIDADLGLAGGDLRAAERSYQLLHQVSGRAGREEDKGLVIIQSFMPENAVIQALAGGMRDAFIYTESMARQVAKMPPFTRLAAIIISGKNERNTESFARHMVKIAPNSDNIRIFGPTPAPLHLLRGKYRFRILIKTERNINIQKWLKQLLQHVKPPSAITIKVDIDPYNFM